MSNAVKTKHHLSDMRFIADCLDQFVDLADKGFAQHGRGIVFYLEKSGEANYAPAHLFDKYPEENTDERRMLANYDPESEFVMCVIHSDNTLSLYQLKKHTIHFVPSYRTN